MPSRLLVTAFAVLLTSGCASSVTGSPAAGSASAGAAECTYTADTSGRKTGSVAPPETAAVSTDGAPTITFTTDKGPLKIELDPAVGPCSVHNLRYLVGKKFFDGSSCHRLTTSDSLGVLQCGDLTGTGEGTPGYKFEDKLPAEDAYERGVVAMANAGPGTNGCQFFIVHGKAEIDPDYPVLGKVVSGMEVVDKIVAGGVDGGRQDGKPATPLVLTSATEG